jgi:phage terminase large subunit GpA-like protein
MELIRIRVPEGERDPHRIAAEGLAWYACAKCDAKWDDAKRDAAVRAGQWREADRGVELMAYLTAFNPKSIAFQIPSWLSPFVTLSEIMAAWFMAQKSKTALKDFQNGYAAEPWVAYAVERQESVILALCEDRPMGRVPGDGVVSCLTFGADTQDDGWWFKIIAHGWGLARDQWVIRCGFVTTLEALEQVLWSDAYEDADGQRYMVRFGLIDAMGHRTGEVYDFCRRHPGAILPTKGEKTMNQPFAYSRIEYYPGSKKPIPGALQLVRVNTKYFKDQLAAAFAVQAGDPGSIRMPGDLPPGYASHYTSEYVNEKGDWDCRPSAPNHLWDCGVLNACAAELLQVRFWNTPSQKPPEEKPPEPRTGGWIGGGKGNWIKR